MKVVIVGGVAGGASAAARLRRLDERAEIVMLERGEYISYANCGLPYYVGGVIRDPGALSVQTPESLRRRMNIDVRTRSQAVGLDLGKKVVIVRGGEGVYEERYDKLILAPGAEPVRPNLPGADGERIFTLRTLPDTFQLREFVETRRPRAAVVVGGGAIGLETAENLAAAGLAVTVVELSDHLVPPLDAEMAADVHRYLAGKGVKLRLNTAVTEFRHNSGLTVCMGEETLDCDLAVLAVGVRPDTRLARDAGLAVSKNGAIVVDEFMRTSDSDVYAVGDAVQTVDYVSGEDAYVPLAGPANKQGRIAANHICGCRGSYSGTQGSWILKLFDMTVAMTGLNERAAKRLGLDYGKAYNFSASHAAYYPGADNMRIKTIFENRTGKILGAQIVGFSGVDKRCDVLAAAIRGGMTAYDLTELELCYAPPFGSAKDPVNMAGYTIENVLEGKVKQYFVEEIAEIRKNPAAVFLDTRTEAEFARGHIPGAVNIPLDSLRQRLGELDPARKLYVNCQSGLRSYLACRILSQNGFDCYNLGGGYRLYESVAGQNAFSPKACYDCGLEIEY